MRSVDNFVETVRSVAMASESALFGELFSVVGGNRTAKQKLVRIPSIK
jgi:hypothetical protein